jgi:hypothetical protein
MSKSDTFPEKASFYPPWWASCLFFQSIVWYDVKYANAPFLVHYGIVLLVTIITTIIEFYLLFLISLKAVHDVSELINMHANDRDYLDGIFGAKNILARTALELPDVKCVVQRRPDRLPAVNWQRSGDDPELPS